jgi:hypothetical protein
MLSAWRQNIQSNLELVAADGGPGLVAIVSGSHSDRSYWQAHLEAVRGDLFRRSEPVKIRAVHEKSRKGNFLGTLGAWAEATTELALRGESPPELALISMVFGRGTRLSPFTQSLGNRKPAFPTPRLSERAQSHLCIADLSMLYSNLWADHLRRGGFRGVIVKWGDEAIIPGVEWGPRDLGVYDAARFVWRRVPTETLAREKEWIAIERGTGRVLQQFARQGLDSLRGRLAEQAGGEADIGVNLGSLAVSHAFLAAAGEVFAEDVQAEGRWADWDPYVWMALHCRDEAAWEAERAHEVGIGKTGIRDLEVRVPGFFGKIQRLRQRVEAETGRPFAAAAIDFGEPLWVDFGLHTSMRQVLESVLADTAQGAISRQFFGIAGERDSRGNIVVRSVVPPAADIRDSIILDAVIRDPRTVMRNGLVVGGTYGRVTMPEGGSALSCAVEDLRFAGPGSIAFRALGQAVDLPARGRRTTLLLPEETIDLVTNEAVVDYGGAEYDHPILGNPISFAEAERRMAVVDPHRLEERWRRLLRGEA